MTKTEKKSRGLRNNNPGNIRHSATGWQGEVAGDDRSFKTFGSMAYGYRAMFVLLQTYQRKYRLNTIREIITRYAPPVENHTDNYIKRVSRSAGVAADSAISVADRDVMIPIVAAMSEVENGVPAVWVDVEAGWDLFVRR